MAGVRSLLIISAVICLSYALQGFGDILDDTKECEESCSNSYTPHTNPQGGDENGACSRGCRFYTINQLVQHFGDEDDSSSLSSNKESCFNDCIESYNETSDNTAACKFGCESQENSSKTKKEDEQSKGRSIHLLSPLVQVRSVYSSLVGAVHVVRSSLITYFTAEDNSIVAVESSPEIMVEVLGQEEDKIEEEGKNKDYSAIAHHVPRIIPQRAGGSEPSVVRCVSKRLGVPPGLLVASALVLVLFTIYVIFTICTTASPAKPRKDGLSVQSDPLPVPIKLVRPEDLTRLSLMEEEDLQAPPLPTKVKLPDTHV